MSAPKADVLPITPWEIKKFFDQITVMECVRITYRLSKDVAPLQ